MKKVLFLFMSFCMVANILLFTPAFVLADTIEVRGIARASDYISSYRISIDSPSSGRILINAGIDTFYTDGTSIDITLQALDNGVWKYVTSWSESNSKQTMSIEKSYNSATSGKNYRAVATYNALKGGQIVESRSLTSSSFTAQ